KKVEPSTHDRRESRRATIMRNTSLAAVHGFPGVVAIGRVTSRRQLHGHRAEPSAVRYYLLSKYMSAKRLLQVTRSHWTIENQLHWVLDVHFDEDGNRARMDNAPENLAILRRLALNILRSYPGPTSIRRKIKRAGWDDSLLLAMLGHMR
ncbi:MAG: ISAs1 family transposase, partial [Burkholderiales bacterium]